MIRDWLSAVLRNESPQWPFANDMAYQSILDEADAEGVIALLHERISSAGDSLAIPDLFLQQLAQAARDKSRQSLMREAECRRILARLQQAGINALLLKGSALAYWAYPSAHLRDCSDVDLLFESREKTEHAIVLLQSMQYNLRDTALAGDLVSFEQTCVRDSTTGACLEIDLHWRLSSSPLFGYRFDFSELNAAAIVLPRLGPHARGLSQVHAFFNACTHRIQNMSEGTENNLKWLYDLHLLGTQFSRTDWQSLVDISIERKLAACCLDGLLMTRQQFNTAVPEPVLAALGDAAKTEPMKIHKMNRWFYIQRMSFLVFPTTAMRIRWLKQRLLPNTAYLQTRYGKNTVFGLVYKRVKAGLQRLIYGKFAE